MNINPCSQSLRVEITDDMPKAGAVRLKLFHLCIIIHYGWKDHFYCKEINTLIEQGSIKLIKSHSKYIYNVTKISISI